jgi:ABC-type Fe3+ transport system permease subunit
MEAYLVRLPYYFYLVTLLFIFITGISFFLIASDNYIFNFFNYSNAIFFTFFQAAVATFFSSILGFLFSLILYLSGKSERLVSAFLNFCFILPVIFVSFGIIFFYSSNGVLSKILSLFSLDYDFKIFSFTGIIYVTSYFNIAFNANFFFRKLVNLPENYIKILKSNNITFWTALRLQIRGYLFQGYRSIVILTLIFCASNFTILYLLSGSPRLVTIELSIYQSIIFNADLYSGITLGIIQLILMLFLSSLIMFNQNYDQSFNFNKSSNTRFPKNILISMAFYAIVFYFLIPFLILIKGLFNFNTQLFLSMGFLNSIFNSLKISFLSVSLSVFISLSALFTYRSFLEKNSKLKNFTFLSITSLLFIPSLTLSSIIFYLNFNLNFIFSNYLIVSVINGFFITPIVFVFLSSKFIENYFYESKQCLIFNISPIIRLIKIDIPKIKNELVLVTSAVFVLSLGDLTSITIFNDSSFLTIPLFISQLYNNYKYDDAFFILSLFIILIFLIMYLPSRFLNRNA